jgi:Xaa-Pro aminopeptidase
MVREPFARLESLPKPDRSKLLEYPTLSLKERDRRWSLIRKMMKENEVEALIVLPGRPPFDDPTNYLTNSGSFWVFFPLQGEPVAFGGGFYTIPSLMNSEAYGIESWVKDWRFVGKRNVDELVKILREMRLTSAHIGTIASSHFAGPTQALMTNNLTNVIKTALPNISFVELWKPYVQIWLVKSEEEIAMFRKAALAGEVAAEEFADACKPGNTLLDIQNAVMSTLIPYGVDIMRPTMLGSGPNGGREIYWLEKGVKPPVLNKGDLVYSEIFCNVGSLHSQVQPCVSIGEPTAEKKKLASLAREAYEIGVETLRPGITFGQLAEAMNKPQRRETSWGAWKMSPLAHSLNPVEASDTHPEGMFSPGRGFPGLKERFGDVHWLETDASAGRPRNFDLVIQEGMTFEFETNACYGPIYVDIGGNILVTKDGCEELNKIPTQMIVAPA